MVRPPIVVVALHALVKAFDERALVARPPVLIHGVQMLTIDRRSSRDDQRKRLKKEFWKHEIAWKGPQEKGYFCAPRSLCFLLQALGSKAVSGNTNPSIVYLELLTRHHGQGVIEMTHNEDHAYAAGYRTKSGLRTWRNAMKLLEDARLRTFDAKKKKAKGSPNELSFHKKAKKAG